MAADGLAKTIPTPVSLSLRTTFPTFCWDVKSSWKPFTIQINRRHGPKEKRQIAEKPSPKITPIFPISLSRKGLMVEWNLSERERERENAVHNSYKSTRANCHLGLFNGTMEVSVAFGSSGISDALPVWGLPHLWGLSDAVGLPQIWGWLLMWKNSLLLW